jgi:hypothetical protein
VLAGFVLAAFAATRIGNPLLDGSLTGPHGTDALQLRLAIARAKRQASDDVRAGMCAFEAIYKARRLGADRLAMMDKKLARRFLMATAELTAVDMLYPDAYRIHDQRPRDMVVTIDDPHFREDLAAAVNILD